MGGGEWEEKSGKRGVGKRRGVKEKEKEEWEEWEKDGRVGSDHMTDHG